jgi:predicted TIM-barrel fold metal-dependent hydrolase
LKGETPGQKIDFEAHFYTPEYIETMYHNTGYPRLADDDKTKDRRLWYNAEIGQPFPDFLLNSLLNLGEERLKRMDACGVDMQILSLSAPGLEQLDPTTGTALARKANNTLSEVIKQYPERFMGYAALAPGNPQEAADELERCVHELGFKGWNTHSNYGDTYLDDKKYLPIIEQAEKLNVPIYLHPTVPVNGPTEKISLFPGPSGSVPASSSSKRYLMPNPTPPI